MRSANPTLRAFSQPQTWDDAHGGRPVAGTRSNVMTVGGTVTATGILLGICTAAAIGSWAAATSASYSHLMYPMLIGGCLGGLVLAMVITFKPGSAPYLAPVYAALEGLFLGAFSFLVGGAVSTKLAGAEGAGAFAAAAEGKALVFQAIGLTFAITAAMLFCYATRIIRPGRVFRAVVISAGGGVCLFAFAAFGLALFGNHTLIGVYSPTNGGLISVGFSLLVVVIASLFLVLDFQFIEQGVRSGMPKHMEWYAGFALLVTLVWLYVELLRLLAKLRSSN